MLLYHEGDAFLVKADAILLVTNRVVISELNLGFQFPLVITRSDVNFRSKEHILPTGNLGITRSRDQKNAALYPISVLGIHLKVWVDTWATNSEELVALLRNF